MLRTILGVTVIAALAGCVQDTGSRDQTGVATVNEPPPASCRYVMDLFARTDSSAPMSQQLLDITHMHLKRLAAQNGANAVSFQPVELGTLVSSVRGTAYSCQ